MYFTQTTNTHRSTSSLNNNQREPAKSKPKKRVQKNLIQRKKSEGEGIHPTERSGMPESFAYRACSNTFQGTCRIKVGAKGFEPSTVGTLRVMPTIVI